MILVDLINQLDDAGTLKQLYRAGCITIRTYDYRDIYQHYQALLAMPQYADRPGQARRETARQMAVSRTTVWRALEEMGKVI